ncbi:MAG: hypothetical protein P8L85_10010 [Rubripirellula sp.]|nr:hypothetical protein [Rubripirellula sp.]
MIANTLEENLSRGLRAACGHVTDRGELSQSDEFRQLTSCLEFYLPAVLREVHPFWVKESLDGLFHEVAIKTGPQQVDLAGRCILISDQTVTSYHVQLRADPAVDEIEWIDCRLGETRDDVMVRVPYDRGSGLNRIPRLVDRLDSIKWRFHVGFGGRELKT